MDVVVVVFKSSKIVIYSSERGKWVKKTVISVHVLESNIMMLDMKIVFKCVNDQYKKMYSVTVCSFTGI